MALNKQSNIYTIIYITILVVIVGAALAFTSLSLKDRQQANIDADAMRQILASVHMASTNQEAIALFDQYITDQLVVNAQGETLGHDAFAVDVKKQSTLAADQRLLPVYVCTTADHGTKYILPIYGNGLWGPIWGYISFDADGTTIYGAYFAHQGETPGLGAEIEKPAFSDQFDGKQMFKDGQFIPVEVVKNGQKPTGNADYVDGISGGTITSKGVGAMIDNCLTPYKNFLETLKNQ